MKLEAFPNIEPKNIDLSAFLFEVLAWRYFDKEDLRVTERNIKIILDEKEIIYLKGIIDTLSNVRFEEPDTSKALEIVRSLSDLITGLQTYKSLIIIINHE